MSRPRMRPTFAVDADCTREELMTAFRRHLVLDAEDVEGEFSTRHGVLRIPDTKSRLWTPCLDLTVEDREAEDFETKTPELQAKQAKLWGTFSPRPEIWTGFVFSIGTLVILSIFSFVYGIAQLALGHAPIALLMPVVALVVGVLLYLSALVGQGLSISEMYRLRAFVDDCLREAESAPTEEPFRAQESSQL
jgi:hypothetical protein